MSISPLAVATTCLLLAACAERPAGPSAAPVISRAGDTTFVTTAEPGLDGAVTLTERWVLAPDSVRLGAIGAAALGSDGAVWYAASGGTDHAALYRDGKQGDHRAIALQGTATNEFTGPLLLTTLADGGLVAFEQATGRGARYDSLGVVVDTLAMPWLAGATSVTADRSGGWFVRGASSDWWWHHARDGVVTDTVRVAAGWDGVIAIGRDGSLLRAPAGGRQLERRAGNGPILTARWEGAALVAPIAAAHDARGFAWVGDATTWRAFDRDGQLRFTVALPEGETLVDRDGEYLLLRRKDGGLRVMEARSPER
jgi:hypothetical protein